MRPLDAPADSERPSGGDSTGASGRGRGTGLGALGPVVPLLAECRWLIGRFAFTSLARAGLMLAGVLLIREFLAGVLGEGTGLAESLGRAVGPAAGLWLVAALLVVSFIGASLFNYDSHIVQQRIIRRIELGLMSRLIRHLVTLSVGFFDRQSRGDLIQAVRHDVSGLRVVTMALGAVFLESAVALALLAGAFHLSPQLAVWVLVVLPLACLPLVWVAGRARERSFRVRGSGYRLFDAILQLVSGVRILKVYGGERREADSAVRHAGHYFDELLQAVRLGALSQLTLEALGGISIVAVVLLGGYQVMAGGLSWAELMAFLVAVKALHAPLNNIGRNYLQMQGGAASVQRIASLLAERPAVAESPHPVALAGAPRQISFEGVAIDFGCGPVLSGLGFTVTAGETIGIVGPSGAGKSTLLGLIARFHDPTRGVVRFDGQDLRQLRLDDLYARLAMVTQEPFLFSASVGDNILIGRPGASAEQVQAAARAASVDAEIRALPQGYDTPVGLGGHPVSRGQAQRINLARAILKDAPILLLDEPTSSLDALAELEVREAIGRMRRGRTSFVVAHRLATVRDASRIMVLDRGGCVAMGPHRELLRDCLLYREMWLTQQRHGTAAEAGGPETGVLVGT